MAAKRRSTPKAYEGSAADIAEDVAGARQLGLSKAAYEKTARDRAEDRRGRQRMRVKAALEARK